MGINRVIDFGSVEVAKPSKNPLSAGTWLADAKAFKFVEANSGNVGIEVTYKVTDEEAVDIEGDSFTRNVWDTMWFSEKSLKMTKIKLDGLGVDVDTLIITSNEDLKDLVEDLRAGHTGMEVKLVTEVEDDEYNGEMRQRTRVKFVNSLD